MSALHMSSSHVEKEGGTNPLNHKGRIYIAHFVDCGLSTGFATRGNGNK
jgi:hypothetical protein